MAGLTDIIAVSDFLFGSPGTDTNNAGNGTSHSVSVNSGHDIFSGAQQNVTNGTTQGQSQQSGKSGTANTSFTNSVTSSKSNTVNSGSQNTSFTQFSDDTISALLKQSLESTNGLASVVTGEKVAGMYDTTVNSQLSAQLLSNVATDIAAKQATQVSNIGGSSTASTGVSNTSTTSSSNSDTESVSSSMNTGASQSAQNIGEQRSSVGPSTTISDGVNTSSSKSSSSQDGICFITTAVCKFSGKPDDCEELQTLRHFRDTYMQETPERAAEVKLYYAEAPKIDEAVSSQEFMQQHYAQFNTLIQIAVIFIKMNELELAYLTYKSLFRQAQYFAYEPKE